MFLVIYELVELVLFFNFIVFNNGGFFFIEILNVCKKYILFIIDVKLINCKYLNEKKFVVIDIIFYFVCIV